MRFYTSVIRVPVPAEVLKRAWSFANAVTPTTNYADANQHFSTKIINDHFISKIGEESVKTVMERFGIVQGPDYTVYEGKSKSWQEDLFVNGTGLAVKTQKQSAALRYGRSWTFQCSPSRRDIILDKPDAWVVFTAFDDLSETPSCHVFPPFQIRELVFEEPVLPHLKAHKKVVYERSLRLG